MKIRLTIALVNAVAGTPFYVWIHAVFVSKVSGDALLKYAGAADMDLWITPSYENPSWSIIAISFISLLAMSAVLASCFFVRRHRIRRARPSAPHVREFHGISSRLVKAMPTLIFTAVLEDNCTSQMCTICLEDYIVGEKLRVLPCRHSKSSLQMPIKVHGLSCFHFSLEILATRLAVLSRFGLFPSLNVFSVTTLAAPIFVWIDSKKICHLHQKKKKIKKFS